MLDMHNTGLDGGSVVQTIFIGDIMAAIRVGPEYLTHRFPKRALCFGGFLTGSDTAIAARDISNLETHQFTSKALHHKFGSVANAIGAAKSKLSTTVNIFIPIKNGRSSTEDEHIIQSMISEATTERVHRGASKDTVKVIFQEPVALPYIANKVHAFVQVVADLDTSSQLFEPVEKERRFTKISTRTGMQSPGSPRRPPRLDHYRCGGAITTSEVCY
jgi:hypothetical protein